MSEPRVQIKVQNDRAGINDRLVRPCQSWGLVIEQGDDSRAGGQRPSKVDNDRAGWTMTEQDGQ